MARASRALLGRHDFMAFCHDRTPGDATVRTVTRVSVDTRPGGFILVDVQANAFLHQMVRLLVANLRLVGSGERPESWLAEVLASRNRHLAGKGAPPSGLFLMRIGYPVADDFSPTGEDAGDESHEEFSG